MQFSILHTDTVGKRFGTPQIVGHDQLNLQHIAVFQAEVAVGVLNGGVEYLIFFYGGNVCGFDRHDLPQELDNGYVRITVDYSAPEGLQLTLFDPPSGELIRVCGAIIGGEREYQSFDVKAADARSVEELTVSFYSTKDNRFFLVIYTSGI